MLRKMCGTLGAAALAVGLMAGAAAAQDYPNGPITLVLPYNPGGASDLLARIVGKRLSERLGVPVLAENRPGASGTIGTGTVARAQPDGYTLLITTSATTIQGALNPNIAYDVRTDLKAIEMIGWGDIAIIASEKVPATTLAEFVEYGKQNSGNLRYGTAGRGTGAHFGALKFLSSTGIEATHVPYAGNGPTMIATVAGEVEFAVDVAGPYFDFAKDGKVRVLAVSGPARSALYPDVPTVTEAGFPDMEYTFMIGVMAPGGTPDPVIEKLRTEIREIVTEPAIEEEINRLNFQVDDGQSGTFESRILGELDFYKEFGEREGIVLQ